MTPRLPDPDDCYWCDQPKRGHFQRRPMGVGFHKYVAPGNGMRLARMQARRAARLAAKQPKPPTPAETVATFVVEDRCTPVIEGIVEKLDFTAWSQEIGGGNA